jgi:hypothetical protein
MQPYVTIHDDNAIKDGEMGEACGMPQKNNKCMKNCSRKILKEEATLEI